jgi:hypothetical protein
MLQVFIVWLERVASDVTGFYCLVRGSCFRCYRNIVWLEGVASDVTGTLSGWRELLQMLQEHCLG